MKRIRPPRAEHVYVVINRDLGAVDIKNSTRKMIFVRATEALSFPVAAGRFISLQIPQTGKTKHGT